MKSLKEALDIFEKETVNQSVATESGDYKAGNKSEKKIQKSIEFIKAKFSLNELLPFLYHDNLNTKIWAASYLLNDYEIAEEVLNEIAEMNGIHSLIAKTTLSEWRKGNLKF